MKKHKTSLPPGMKYPPNSAILADMEALSEKLFMEEMPPAILRDCMKIASYLDFILGAWAYYERYALAFTVADQDVARLYGEAWNTFPDQIKRKILKGRDDAEKKRIAQVHAFRKLLEEQRKAEAMRSPEQNDKIEQMQETLSA